LGSDKKAKIRVGTEDFGVAIAARTFDGGSAKGSIYIITIKTIKLI
jgi:hypothetical protein